MQISVQEKQIQNPSSVSRVITILLSAAAIGTEPLQLVIKLEDLKRPQSQPFRRLSFFLDGNKYLVIE